MYETSCHGDLPIISASMTTVACGRSEPPTYRGGVLFFIVGKGESINNGWAKNVSVYLCVYQPVCLYILSLPLYLYIHLFISISLYNSLSGGGAGGARAFHFILNEQLKYAGCV